MQVQERIIDGIGGESDEQIGWFAARQPGILRYLEAALGAGSDAMGAALMGACAVHAAFQQQIGVPPARVAGSLLARAEAAVITEAGQDVPPTDGFVTRQPALAEYIAGVVAFPPTPLDERDSTHVGLLLAAVLYALDEVTTGRAIP